MFGNNGKSYEVIIPLSKINKIDAKSSHIYPNHMTLYYGSTSNLPEEIYQIWLYSNNCLVEIVDGNARIIDSNEIIRLYDKEDVVNHYDLVMIRNKLVLFAKNTKNSIQILRNFNCLNRDCYENDCLVAFDKIIFCGICGMEFKIDSCGSMLKRSSIEDGYKKAIVFVGK